MQQLRPMQLKSSLLYMLIALERMFMAPCVLNCRTLVELQIYDFALPKE